MSARAARHRRLYKTRRGFNLRVRKSAAKELRRLIKCGSIQVTDSWIRIYGVRLDPNFGWQVGAYQQLGFEVCIRRYRIERVSRTAYVRRRRFGANVDQIPLPYLDIEIEHLIKQHM